MGRPSSCTTLLCFKTEINVIRRSRHGSRFLGSLLPASLFFEWFIALFKFMDDTTISEVIKKRQVSQIESAVDELISYGLLTTE